MTKQELPALPPNLGAMVVRHLAQAEDHVALSRVRIARQTEIVAELERGGHEQAAQTARELLATFEDTLQSHLDDRERLLKELDALD
jgi:hypothetical protein